MLMAQPWAADAAAAALTAAAAAEESRHVSDVCGLVVQQLPHTQPSAPAAALLRLAPTLQRRITQELKIHRHQVSRCYCCCCCCCCLLCAHAWCASACPVNVAGSGWVCMLVQGV